MFNLINNVYLLNENERTTSTNVRYFNDFININKVTNETEPNNISDLEAYLVENNNVNDFLKDLVFKASLARNAHDINFCCNNKNYFFFLALWFDLHFKKASKEDFHEFIRIFVENEILTHYQFKQIPKLKVFEEEQSLIDFSKDTEEVYRLFDVVKSLKIDDEVRAYFLGTLSLEWLLLARLFNPDDKDIKIAVDIKLKRMLQNVIYRTLVREAKEKLKKNLPRVNKLRENLHFVPHLPYGYVDLVSDEYFGLLLNPRVSKEQIISKFSDPEFIKLMHNIVYLDVKPNGNLDNHYFLQGDLSYDSLIEAIKNTSMNFLFHEKDVYWDKINHVAIGLFVQYVKKDILQKDKDIEYSLNFIKEMKK